MVLHLMFTSVVCVLAQCFHFQFNVIISTHSSSCIYQYFYKANHAKFCHNKYTFPSLAQNMRKGGEIVRCILLGKEKFRTLPPKKNVNLNKI